MKPLDHTLLHEKARNSKLIVTLEEHTVIGGLGSAVVESLVDAGMTGKTVKRLGFPDVFTDELGSQAEIMTKYGLDPESVSTCVESMVSRTTESKL